MLRFAVQISDDHLGYLLRWASLLDGQMRSLAINALRPTKDTVLTGPTRPVSGGGGGGDKSRYFRVLWRHAVNAVLRVIQSSGSVALV